MSTDDFFINSRLRLLCNGTNGSTTFTDSSSPAKTITATGSVRVNTSFKKYGTGAAEFYATGAYLSAGSASDWTWMHLTDAKWTVRGWVSVTNFSVLRDLFSTNSGSWSNSGVRINIGATTRLVHFEVSRGSGTNDVVDGDFATAFPNDSDLHHVAITYDNSLASNNATLYIDGTASGTLSKTVYACSSAAPSTPARIGGYGTTGNFLGTIDDFDVTQDVILYTGNFPPPIEELPTTQTELSITAAVTLPALSANLYSGVVADMTLPAISASIYAGAFAAIELPAISAEIYAGTIADITLPAIQAFAGGHDSTGERAAAITLPSLSASAYSGANATLELPSLSASADGTVTILAQAPITLPAFTSAATGTVTSMAHAGISLPSLNSVAYSGAVCSITIGAITTVTTGVTGSVGQAHITLPLFDATAETTVGIVASAAITLPSLTMQTGSHVAVSLPPLSMVAIGTAVVTATYEAYAVNLGHVAVDAAQGAIDEVTRYTNFPFTHVVRYQNHYYGANSTGLYLLEGTTDAGTAIPWAVKTGIDDFKTPQKKTVAAAYFAGRFGPASTIQLYAGEQAPNTYSFSTPRDALAQNHRQVFGKGVKERFYALGASGTGTVELDGIELEVHTLSRRI